MEMQEKEGEEAKVQRRKLQRRRQQQSRRAALERMGPEGRRAFLEEERSLRAERDRKLRELEGQRVVLDLACFDSTTEKQASAYAREIQLAYGAARQASESATRHMERGNSCGHSLDQRPHKVDLDAVEGHPR